jgi:hypothetical protein
MTRFMRSIAALAMSGCGGGEAALDQRRKQIVLIKNIRHQVSWVRYSSGIDVRGNH